MFSSPLTELNDLPMGCVKILANITDHGLDRFFLLRLANGDYSNSLFLSAFTNCDSSIKEIFSLINYWIGLKQLRKIISFFI